MLECWNCGADLDEFPPGRFRRESGEPVSYCSVCEAGDPHNGGDDHA